MKHLIAVATLVLGMSLGFTSHASAQEDIARVTVPFDFAVGNRVLPQGTYHIDSDGAFLAFNNPEKGASLFTFRSPGEASKDGKSMLVFDKLEGQYFLRKIVSPSEHKSVDFPISTLEEKTKESEGTRDTYAENSNR